MKFPVFSLLTGNFRPLRDEFARDWLLHQRVSCEPDSISLEPDEAKRGEDGVRSKTGRPHCRPDATERAGT